MRRSKAQIRDEYIRLADCWAYAREYTIAELSAEGGLGFDVASTLPTEEELIAEFDTGKPWNKRFASGEFTSSELLNGLKQSLMDTVIEINEALEYGSTVASSFLERYQSETGRHFFTDAGDPKKIVKKILSKGLIKNENEFYVLKEVLSDLEQSTISTKDMPRAEEILHVFEFGKGR